VLERVYVGVVTPPGRGNGKPGLLLSTDLEDKKCCEPDVDACRRTLVGRIGDPVLLLLD
jgi:hypothetical protein